MTEDRGLPVAPVAEWLTELGITPVETAEREGVRSWDLLLDGRVRRRVRATLILDPALALVGWVHYAPPLTDSVRRAYRQLLRWNDEIPFAKFSISTDDRPILSAELPALALSRDAVGVLLARLLAICDLLYPESAKWVDRISAKAAAGAEPDPAGRRLIERYAAELGELGSVGTDAHGSG